MHFLGRGKFASCFRVGEPPVAVKCIAAKQLTQKRILFLQNEVKTLQRVQHAAIVKFIKWSWTLAGCVIILEFCDGGTLFQRVRGGQLPLTANQVWAWMQELLHALEYLHNNTIIHRDIKLHNILLHQQHVKVSDFGFAVPGPTATGMLGTPNYMAPEILQKQVYGYAVDVWAAGCCVYALLHQGQGPFQCGTLADTYSHIKKYKFHSSNLDSMLSIVFVSASARPTAQQFLRMVNTKISEILL